MDILVSSVIFLLYIWMKIVEGIDNFKGKFFGVVGVGMVKKVCNF